MCDFACCVFRRYRFHPSIGGQRLYYNRIRFIIIYPLTARVVGAPQMISQPVFSIFPCSPLLTGTWRTLGLPIPSCCLPTSSSVCLVFFPLSPCLARWFWPDLINGRNDHTTAACVFLQWSGVRLVSPKHFQFIFGDLSDVSSRKPRL